MSKELTENFSKLIVALREAEEAEKNMTDEEKQNNTVKMHIEKGDIWY